MKQTNNIFERVAEKLEKSVKSIYKDNPISTKYFSLTNSTDLKEMGGPFPQTDYINLDLAHSIEYRKLSNFPINFERIELCKSSKLTDNISTAAISAHAFVLSKRALEIFTRFDLGKYKIYPAKIFHKGVANDYGVLHFINDEFNKLDFEKSRFYVSNILGEYEFDIEIKSKEDYEEKRQLVNKGKYPKTEKWWYVKLKFGIFKQNKNEEIRNPDLFTIFLSSQNTYISVGLTQAIIDNNLTGFKIGRINNIQD